MLIQQRRKEATVLTTTTPDTAARGPSCWTTDYILRHCETFRVDGPGGRLGYVDEVRLTSTDELEALVVSGGIVVQAALVEDIDPLAEVIRVRAQP
jgi:hypothetical protein